MKRNLARSLEMIATCGLVACIWDTCRAGIPFVTETVDASGSVGQYTSLALDGYGNPHISYFDAGGGRLKYAVKRRGTWSIEIVDATGVVGQYTSLALDRTGSLSISYYDVTNRDLKFAARMGATWLIETVDSAGDVGQYSSLGLDGQGEPHIGYYDATNAALKYASRSNGTWSIETVASGGYGQYCSLRLDREGRPKICYMSQAGSLRYATKPAGSWVVETVSNAYQPGLGPTSLALDARGHPHISYQATYQSWVGVAIVMSNPESWGWFSGTRIGSSGTYSSIALDVSGTEHLAYYDSNRRLLGYSSLDNHPDTFVDGAGDVGQYLSLALDAEGNPRISYYNASNGALKYTDSAVHLLSPRGGETWQVGSLRDIEWSGVGPLTVEVSADGGANYQTLQTNVTTSPWTVRVPLLPTRFARIRILRAAIPSYGTERPPSTAASDSFFTIEATVALLAFEARLSSTGVVLSWRTRPGPEDLAGYRLDRAGAGAWETVVDLTRETGFVDARGGPGSRYRLTAVNGLGQPLVLGEASPRPGAALAAWPMPYRGGALQVSFATSSGVGGGPGLATVEIYDVTGRRVRTLVRGEFPAGYQTAIWDGRNERGLGVPSGLYVIRATTGGSSQSLKVVTTR